ncbi:MAG: M20 family metallopeptidase [Acidimicrobiia bacterium]
MSDAALLDRALEALDAVRAVERLRGAVAAPSVTGAEAAYADLITSDVEGATPMRFDRIDVEPGRPMLLGRWGGGSGRTLLLAGHLDTVRPAGWQECWGDDERADPHAAVVRDGAIWGIGVADLKGGICAVTSALEAIARAGLRPAGTVLTAWIPDEESGEPDLGRSAGMRELARRIEHGELAPDGAIYVEPTELAVYAAQIGFVIAELAVEGQSAYFGTPERGSDALRAMTAALEALWRIADRLRETPEHELLGRPVLVVHRADAGGPIALPGSASASLIRTVLPGESLDAAAKEIEAAVRAALPREVRVTFTYPAGRDHPLGGLAMEAALDADLIAKLADAVGAATGSRGRIAGAPYWSELSFLAELGIPGAYFAPGDIGLCHTPEEHIPLDQYLYGAESLCRLVAAYCGLEPDPAPSRVDRGVITQREETSHETSHETR